MFVRVLWSCLIILVVCEVEKCSSNYTFSSSNYTSYIHTASEGGNVTFNCREWFPKGSYEIEWYKKINVTYLAIGIWSESNSSIANQDYKGRVSFNSTSLNLAKIRLSDQGIYVCNIVDLTGGHRLIWFNLDVVVYGSLRFIQKPSDLIHVHLDDNITLACKAEGNPAPTIFWYKNYLKMVENATAENTLHNGTELRLPNIQNEDVGNYTCIADNEKTQISHTTRVVIAEDPVIMVPPNNQTKVEGEKVRFTCDAEIQPIITIEWFHNGVPVEKLSSLVNRAKIRNDGSLTITAIDPDDSGEYSCQVSNGNGDSQSASAYLNVEYPAKVTFTPTIQYLPHGLSGMIQCFTSANPPLEYVAWTKDKQVFDHLQSKNIVLLNNGSLLINRSDADLEGNYTCIPYNIHGTQGSSRQMQVLVRQPPVFIVVPEKVCYGEIGGTIEMHCDAQDVEGTEQPTILWQKQAPSCSLAEARVKRSGGNITIKNLQYSDLGFYECLASNEVTTVTAVTHLVINESSPQSPCSYPMGTID